MNCKCISELTENIEDQIKKTSKFKKPVESVSWKETTFVRRGDTMVLGTFSTAEVSLQGQKKKEPVNVLHTFCPFCGVSTKRNEDEATS